MLHITLLADHALLHTTSVVFLLIGLKSFYSLHLLRLWLLSQQVDVGRRAVVVFIEVLILALA